MHIDQLDGNEGVVETWTLEGCWFLSVEMGDVNYQEGSSIRLITTQISYDHAYQTLNGQGYGTAIGGIVG